MTSSNVAFRNIFDPYCAEYGGINDDERLAILREMMHKGIITSLVVFHKCFMDLFADNRPDISNVAPDGMALLLDHVLQTWTPVVPKNGKYYAIIAKEKNLYPVSHETEPKRMGMIKHA
jgi:hypothetical protein